MKDIILLSVVIASIIFNNVSSQVPNEDEKVLNSTNNVFLFLDFLGLNIKFIKISEKFFNLE